MGKFDEAERVLQEAMSKSATDPNTLANMAATMHTETAMNAVADATCTAARAASPCCS